MLAEHTVAPVVLFKLVSDSTTAEQMWMRAESLKIRRLEED
jgi:hypothetical protein